MTKKKVAILGGGMAGLTTAYELTKTQELRDRHEVTVYQMGWRLGGKAASGRDAQDRNVEHGLHVWFGCYENVFRLVKDLYRDWQKPQHCPLRDWTDVAKPQVFTPIGVQGHDGSWAYFPLEFAIHGGEPGDGHEIPWSPWEVLGMLSDMFIQVVRDGTREYEKLRANGHVVGRRRTARSDDVDELSLPFAFADIAAGNSRLNSDERGRARSLWNSSRAQSLSFEHYAEAAHLWTKNVAAKEGAIDRATVEEISTLYSNAYAEFAAATEGTPRLRALGATLAPIDVKLRLIGEFVNIFGAMARGYMLDLLLPDRPFEALDDMDLRAWLISHGADEQIVRTSTVLRVVYDTLFQFSDGDTRLPSYAAGTALGCIARLTVTYKSAMMWDIQAGMGEAVIAPLYEVLKARDVKFRFFHKVTKLELSDDRKISRIRVKVQARTKEGKEYVPVKTIRDLVCWPAEPDWSQLDETPWSGGSRPDFESHWLDAAGHEELLEYGTHFHTVVLAISMGAYKNLNPEDKSMCQALIDREPRFRDFVENIGIVPTQSLQLWSDKTLEELGWADGKPATVSGPEYLNIWADMTQVMDYEGWAGPNQPVSLHYFCGTLPTDRYREPASKRSVPGEVRRELRDQQMRWLNEQGHVIWPGARDGKKFDFKVLHGSGSTDEARFEEQYYRANISPTECCVLSSAGTTKYRLHAHEAGFENLVLAGEATRHGFNTTAIEGAVMSGMAASWAICGSPSTIPGYDFLQRKPSDRERRMDEIAPRAGTATLPPYISFNRRGAIALRPPATFRGVKGYFFAVPTAAGAMQKLVDELLMPATHGAVTYEVSMQRALVSFLDIAECTSSVDSFGWVPGRECAIWIPLFERRGRHVRPVLWSPYIFINYAIGMVTGREVWGWPKSFAEILLPNPAAGSVGEFTCKTQIFRLLRKETPGEWSRLFSVTQETPLTRASGFAGKAEEALRCFTNVFTRAAGPLLGAFGVPMLSAVALKQFRDAEYPERACYQAIVNSPVRMTRFRSGGLLTGDFWLNIDTCESHQIAQDLFGKAQGAQGTRCKIESAAWAEFDFEALPGSVIVSSAAGLQ
jgi:uncharacterized protein with NAD-binding domain and iron-sulfur cluster